MSHNGYILYLKLEKGGKVMKKKALILGLILSTAAFGFQRPDYDERDHHKKFREVKEQRLELFENLSQEQKESIKELRSENFKKNSKLKLSIDEKMLKIRRYMMEDNVEWPKIEKLTKEIGILEGKVEYNNLRNRYEINKMAGFEKPIPLRGLKK